MRHLACAGLLLLLSLVACAKSQPARELDLDLIKISGDARLRTDTVGDGRFAETSAFVLVDAENASGEAAYVTLGGRLTDPSGAVVGELRRQSLYIPAHESRTFALVDTERKPRPAATSAQIVVRGATVATERPRARIDDLHTFVDQDRVVLQANLVNEADRIGQIMVVASFHDAQNRPMTRPFELVTIDRKGTTPVQFVGPPHSRRGAIFIADTVW